MNVKNRSKRWKDKISQYVKNRSEIGWGDFK